MCCKVICRTAQHTPQPTQDPSYDYVTVIETSSANGRALAPLVKQFSQLLEGELNKLAVLYTALIITRLLLC